MGGERQVVPKELVDAVARTFDREVYSDVEFVLPDRKRRKVTLEKRQEGAKQGGTGVGYVSNDAGSTFSTSPSNAFAGLGNTLGEATPPTESRGTTGEGGDTPGTKTIWANKEFLRRSEYFESMLEGGFSETAGVSPVSPEALVDDRIAADRIVGLWTL